MNYFTIYFISTCSWVCSGTVDSGYGLGPMFSGVCGNTSKQWANVVFSFVYMHLVFHFYILHSSLRYDMKCLIAYSSTAEIYTFIIALKLKI